jgi:putative DNA primase/helicase
LNKIKEGLLASTVAASKVEMSFWRRFPEGMLSVLAGWPGQSKSLLAVRMSALASQVGNVIYATAEDPLAQVMRPRLDVVGAVLERIEFYSPRLPGDLPELAAKVRQNLVKFVVLDTAAAHLTVSILNDQDVRKALTPLRQLAEETGCTFLFITHLTKTWRPTMHPLTAIGGSAGGLVGAARAVYFLGTAPDDPDERILACGKLAVGPQPKALRFELDIEEEHPIGPVPRLNLLGETDVELSDLLAASGSGAQQKPPEKRSSAAAFLTNYLRCGPRPSAELKEDAAAHGHAWATIRRAADELDVIRRGGPGSTWSLPPSLLEALVEDADPEERP